MRKTTRREFTQEIVWSSLGGYLAFATGACRRSEAPAVDAAAVDAVGIREPLASELKFFDPLQYLTMAAVCEQVLPRDEDPGANDLGVPMFIDRVLATDYDERWQKAVWKGLQRLNDAAKAKLGVLFSKAEVAAQTELLDGWVREDDNDEFWSKVMHLTFEGAFGDPRHGGNKDGAAWRLIGFRGEPCGA